MKGVDLVLRERTRVINSSATCIDHFAIKNVNPSQADVLQHQSFSENYPVAIQFSFIAIAIKFLALYLGFE